jgi:hypothetical protein
LACASCFVGGAAEFGGASFGTGASPFLANMTSNGAVVNNSISNIDCPIPVSGTCTSTACVNANGAPLTCYPGATGTPQTQFTNMDAGIGKLVRSLV